MDGPCDRRKQKRQAGSVFRFWLILAGISDSEPPPFLEPLRLAYKRRVAALSPFLSFPQHHHSSAMKLKFNLFVNLGVIASVAVPGAFAWGAAG